MQRFRRKSDASRPPSDDDRFTPPTSELKHLPELPPAVNFRTSLILPELARRFTLLQSASSDPLTLEDLKSTFAEQRSRGIPNQISEEEEDMILETLGIRSKNITSTTPSSRKVDGSSAGANTPDLGMESDYITHERTSRISTATASTTYPASSITSSPSPSSRSTKRYSNNLFASGRFREYTYLRSVSQRSGSSRGAASIITPSDSDHSLREKPSSNFSESLRPATPEDGHPVSSVPSSPNEKTPLARSASLISSTEDFSSQPPGDHIKGSIQSNNSLGIQRVEAALEIVIREFEEEAEDEILMPRTAHPAPRLGDVDQSNSASPTSESESGTSIRNPQSPTDYEAGTAILSDKQMTTDPEHTSPTSYARAAGTVSPTPRLPGYIPGMPRPMTPREPSCDSDDARAHSATPRAHSATPRAMSPTLPNANGASSLITTTFTSSLLRRGSDASRNTPRPISPSVALPASSFLSRSAGQYSSDSQRESASSTDQEASLSLSTFRRRPASPLTGSAFRPMLVSSRPGTPSNITWNVSSVSSTPTSPNRNHSRRGSASSHSRSGSLGTDSDFQSNADKSKSANRPVRPAPLETPSFTQVANNGAWNRSTSPAVVDNRSPSSLSGVLDLGSSLSVSSRTMRSPTPTQSWSAAASPASSSNDSPDFSNHPPVRSPKHHSKSSSHFSLGLSQPVIFSALANSSRSSLESSGSSYHSWSAGQKKDITLELFNDVEQQPKWHDLDKLSPPTPGSLQDDDDDFEDIIRRCTGLTKSDFVAIQDKLVSAVRAKESNTEPRERTNSLRRRRPSTSQSNYSLNTRDNRVASPPPNQPAPAQVSVAGRRSPAPDQAAKAHALLDSVVGSIPRAPTVSVVTDIKVQIDDSPEVKGSPTTTRRNRDLARALGFADEQALVTLSQSISPSIENVPQSNQPSQTHVPQVATSEVVVPPAQGNIQPPSNAPPSSLPSRSASMRNPQAPIHQADLVDEVRRKVEAATAALMKTSSGQRFTDANASSISVTRKKINPSQISAPHLVSGPTSVETIPLPQIQQRTSPTPHTPQPSLNITQRMRRFRNTLRVKQHVTSGEEVTPFPLDMQPNSVTPSASLNRRPTLSLTKGFPYGSSIDLGKSKSMSSPPASVTPGLRGFMSRFRKPRTPPDAQTENGNGFLRASPTTSSPTTSSHNGQSLGPSSTNGATPASAPSSVTTFVPTVGGGQPNIGLSSTTDEDSVAVKQLFEAATNLGLDQAALNDLLRSASVSSRGVGQSSPKNASNTAAGSHVGRDTPSAAQSRSPLPAASHLNDDGTISGEDDRTVRKLSIHRPVHNRQAIPENPAIVRRTLIFPSDSRTSTPDLNQMSRKPSGKRHRRSGSAMSAYSGRSVHDRAPTPPPPKSTGGKRFSTDRPPLPSLPTSMTAQAEALLHPSLPSGAGEKTGSTYESFYDMYTGESKNTNASADDAVDFGGSHEAEGRPEGTALEVIEMANGETIWSIVNGLRDDDIESAYASRTSLTSEYSLLDNPEGLQVLVKEHNRSVSKSSGSSFLSRKKLSQSKNRPETKVFYSSSAHIGHLIESLSQGMDAGSFNFSNLPPDRSTPSSFHSGTDTHWTIEEKLEQMLGSMRVS